MPRRASIHRRYGGVDALLCGESIDESDDDLLVILGHLFNCLMRTTGHLWQGRFGSVAMDDAHLVYAARYVSLNPVRARLVKQAADWPWSSVRAHLAGEDDGVVRVAPVLDRVGDFAAFLDEEVDEAFTYAALRKAESIGRPVGSPEWLADLEARTGRKLAPTPRGPKPLRGLGVK